MEEVTIVGDGLDHPDTAMIHATPRSSQWNKVRRNYIVKFPECVACGGKKDLQVHHKQPFHTKPELELDESNFMTLCEHPGRDCHLVFGHLGNWKTYDGDPETLAKMYRKRIESAKVNQPENL